TVVEVFFARAVVQLVNKSRERRAAVGRQEAVVVKVGEVHIKRMIAAGDIDTEHVAGLRIADAVERPYAIIVDPTSQLLEGVGLGTGTHLIDLAPAGAVGGLLDDEALGGVGVVAIPGDRNVRAVVIVPIYLGDPQVGWRTRRQTALLLGVLPVE